MPSVTPLASCGRRICPTCSSTERIQRDGLFSWALDVVAHHCVLEAARTEDSVRAAALLCHARRLVPSNVAVLVCANEGRFRLGAHTPELLRDLGVEGGPRPELAVAATQLALAESLGDSAMARRAARRLRELGPRSEHRWAIEVRLALRTPGALSHLDAVAALVDAAPVAPVDPASRAVHALYGEVPARQVAEWRDLLQSRREALELAAELEEERVEEALTRPERPSRPPAPTRPGPNAVAEAIEAIGWRFGRPSLFKSALRAPIQAHVRAALELLDDDASTPAPWIAAIGDPAVGLVPTLDAALQSQSWEAASTALALAEEVLAGCLSARWSLRAQKLLTTLRPGLTGRRPGEAELRAQADALVARVVQASSLAERAKVMEAITALQLAAAALRDPEEEVADAEPQAEPDGFLRMEVSPAVIERSAKELGTPDWALQTGLRLVAAFNAARGNRLRRALRGTRDERGILWELKQIKSHPVRVFYRYVTGGPRVVAIWDKDDNAHQQQIIDLVRTWLEE